MLISGDICLVELGTPAASEAGYGRPVVVVTAQAILDARPSVLQVVPLTTTIRNYETEVDIGPDKANGLTERSAVQCQHIRSISSGRVGAAQGNVGAVVLLQLRELISTIIDAPT